VSILRPLPQDRPVLVWYGDDFTGSAAVMEVLTFAGLPSVLFLEPPTADQLARFPQMRAIGIAGDARSRSPSWMAANLPPVFSALRKLRAPILHYKICSTLDSAPHVGSIGKAAELVLGEGDWAPLIVAAPAIGRWQAFGTLFAAAGDAVHRLDRHPVMRVHPVTPMDEADVRLHLAQQTSSRIGLVDFLALKAGTGQQRLELMRATGASIVAIDVVDDESLAAAGRLVWAAASEKKTPFVAIGSQGLEYALVAAWREAGLAPLPPEPRPITCVDQVAAVSGSCSPVTAEQIALAGEAGFDVVPVDAARAADEESWRKECGRAADAVLASVGASRSVIAVTARGPEDPAIAACADAGVMAGISAGEMNARIGAGLGRLLDKVLSASRLRRAVIAGGDTSSHGARALKLYALTAETAVAPGAPLLRGHSDDPERDGLQLSLKGGQMGRPDFFISIRDGKCPAQGEKVA
jgi:uncharacterized protein YgbK (DUF1537 family)